MKLSSRTGRRFNRPTTRRRMNERIDLIDTQFALQSQEDENLFVAAEEAEEVAEAEDDETGIPFTDSMDENIVMLFPTHEEAKQFAEENGLLDKVTIVAVQVNPDEQETEEVEESEADMEECDMRRMGESLRLRRDRARRLAESRMARNTRNVRDARTARTSTMRRSPRYGRR